MFTITLGGLQIVVRKETSAQRSNQRLERALREQRRAEQAARAQQHVLRQFYLHSPGR